MEKQLPTPFSAHKAVKKGQEKKTTLENRWKIQSCRACFAESEYKLSGKNGRRKGKLLTDSLVHLSQGDVAERGTWRQGIFKLWNRNVEFNYFKI